MSDSKIIVHHLERSRAFRIVWALEELGLDYEIKNYNRTAKGLAPEELKAVYPLGNSPVVEIDGKTIGESGAILNYMQRKFDADNKFKPQSDDALFDYDYWMQFAEGSLMPLIVFTLVTNKLDSDSVPMMARMITKKAKESLQDEFSGPRLKSQVALIEDYLSKNDYFAGDSFSFADVQMSYTLGCVRKFELLKNNPAIEAYLAKVVTRDGFKKAAQKAPDCGGVL